MGTPPAAPTATLQYPQTAGVVSLMLGGSRLVSRTSRDHVQIIRVARLRVHVLDPLALRTVLRAVALLCRGLPNCGGVRPQQLHAGQVLSLGRVVRRQVACSARKRQARQKSVWAEAAAHAPAPSTSAASAPWRRRRATTELRPVDAA